LLKNSATVIKNYLKNVKYLLPVKILQLLEKITKLKSYNFSEILKPIT